MGRRTFSAGLFFLGFLVLPFLLMLPQRAHAETCNNGNIPLPSCPIEEGACAGDRVFYCHILGSGAFQDGDSSCSSRVAHCCHGDQGGTCNGCGNLVVESHDNCCDPDISSCPDPKNYCEECDDGDGDNGDGCNEFCQLENCGDGSLDTGEQCDDGCGGDECTEEDDGDGCDNNCREEFCGDGKVNDSGAEECDDGRQCEDGTTPCQSADDCVINIGTNGFCDAGTCLESDPAVACETNADCVTPIDEDNDGDHECSTHSGDGCGEDCQGDCGNGVVDPGEDCDPQAEGAVCCNEDCTFASEGISCGSEADTECDNPDTCDGSGTCLPNPEDSGANCGDAGTECRNQDTCDGEGGCTDNGDKGSGTSCGSGSDTECDNPDTCNGSGSCQSNHESTEANCGDAGGECTNQDKCDGEGGCHDNGYKEAGTPCGSESDTDCDDPDTCNGQGFCQSNVEQPGTACTDDENVCTDDLCQTCEFEGTRILIDAVCIPGCQHIPNDHVEDCYTGPEGTEGKGICHGGTKSCSDGVLGECVDEVTPETEVCDGIDNDCDGQIDEGLGSTTCGVGNCAHTVANCDGGEERTCDPLEGKSTEVCENGVDDDCDGLDDACAELAGCIALPGNEPPVVTFEGPKETSSKGTFEIPFTVADPDEGDTVQVKVTTSDGSAEVVGNVILFTLATPLSKDSEGTVEVSATVSDSGSCEEKTYKTFVTIGVAGDQIGSGCSLIRR